MDVAICPVLAQSPQVDFQIEVFQGMRGAEQGRKSLRPRSADQRARFMISSLIYAIVLLLYDKVVMNAAR